MKFTSEFVREMNRKAWDLYHAICPANANYAYRRDLIKHCFKVAYRVLKASITGVVQFFKITSKDGEAQVERRNVMTLEQINYQRKTDRKLQTGQYCFVDMDKFYSGVVNPIISFNHYQIL